MVLNIKKKKICPLQDICNLLNLNLYDCYAFVSFCCTGRYIVCFKKIKIQIFSVSYSVLSPPYIVLFWCSICLYNVTSKA